MALPPKGTPQRKHRDEYQKDYRRRNYLVIHLMFNRSNPRDMAILEALSRLPYKTKAEFIKRAVEEKLNIDRPEREKGNPVDSFTAKLDESGY